MRWPWNNSEVLETSDDQESYSSNRNAADRSIPDWIMRDFGGHDQVEAPGVQAGETATADRSEGSVQTPCQDQ